MRWCCNSRRWPIDLICSLAPAPALALARRLLGKGRGMGKGKDRYQVIRRRLWRPAVVAPATSPLTLAATGGLPPYTWSVSAGALPPGIILTAATGVVSGIPSTVGTFTFTVKVTDTGGASAVKDFTIAVKP